MGFYGNITNTARTQFQFDLVYPNRATMEKMQYIDNIYAGRYVLVEYDKEPIINNTVMTEFYTREDANGNIIGSLTNGGVPIVMGQNGLSPKQGDLFYTKTVTTIAPGIGQKTINTIYVVLQGTPGEPAKFAFVTDSENPYIANYNTDIKVYGEGKGYDSTVWQKVYVDGGEKYVMIAELNTVVPTFDVAADAPTMNPIVPHFDINSTDVYYKLHWQAPWGFRIKEAENDDSDETTTHTKYTYHPEDGTHTTETKEVPAAIFYNAPAFNPQVNESDIKKHSTQVTEDKINLSLAKSGSKYNKHDGTTDVEEQDDIQELTVHLPSIGNMMSDAWDIIHGPNRDNARTDENSSLQGRLDSFKEIENNQIPVKRAEDGTLVGSMINNAIAYDDWDKKPIEILKDKTNPGFERDDAWIKTTIDTSGLVGGIKDGDDVDQSANSGISIHHTFHATENSVSTVDKNTGDTFEDENYKSKYIRSTNKDHNTDDVIDLYVPYVDAKGHVVGHNIETVTLPYSYRIFKTQAVSPEQEKDLYTKVIPDTENGANTSSVTANPSDLTADRTQDIFTINPGNKWIQTKLSDENDELIIAHEIHAIDEIAQFSNLNDNNADAELDNDEITVQDLIFDKAGHVIQNRSHTYRLPFGYKTITTNGRVAEDETKNNDGNILENAENRKTVASNTQDTVAVNSGNYWTRVDIENDVVTLSHNVRDITETPNPSSNFNEETDTFKKDNINIPDWTYDAAGHIRSKQDHYYTLPFGFKTIRTNGRGDSLNENAKSDPSKNDIIANNTQDVLNINSGNRWIRIDTIDNAEILNSLTISHDIHETPHNDEDDSTINWTQIETDTTIPTVTYQFDEAGHYISHHIENYQLPYGYGKIKGDNSTSTAATATYDELTFASDNWLTANVGVDQVTYNHDGPNPNKIVYTDKKDQYPSFGSTFTIEDWAFDEKGHQFNNKKSHTVTIPGVVLNNDNSGNVVVGLTLSKATEDNNKTAIFTENKVNVGSLALTDYEIVSHANANDSTDLQPQDTINSAFSKLQTQIYQEEVARADETSRAQGAEKALGERIDALDYSETADNTKIITQITQEDGKITNVARATAGTLVLGNYTKPQASDVINNAITAGDSLNSAFGKVEIKIDELLSYIKTLEDRIAALEPKDGETENP